MEGKIARPGVRSDERRVAEADAVLRREAQNRLFFRLEDLPWRLEKESDISLLASACFNTLRDCGWGEVGLVIYWIDGPADIVAMGTTKQGKIDPALGKGRRKDQMRRVWRDAVPLYRADLGEKGFEDEAAWLEAHLRTEAKTLLDWPIAHGVLRLFYPEPDAFPEETRPTIRRCAQAVERGLIRLADMRRAVRPVPDGIGADVADKVCKGEEEGIRAVVEFERRLQQSFSAVRETIFAMRQPQDLAIVIKEIENQLRGIGLDFNSLTVQVFNEEGTDFTALTGSKDPRDAGKPWWRMLLDEWGPVSDHVSQYPHVAEVWETGQSRYFARYPQGGTTIKDRSILDVAFAQGTLAINHLYADAFTSQDLALVERFGGLLSEAWARFVALRDLHRGVLREQALRASERRYRELLETLPHGVIEVEGTNGGVILFGNTAFARMHGYADWHGAAHTLYDLGATPEDCKTIERRYSDWVRREPEPVSYTARHRHRDGRTIEVQVDWDYRRDVHGRTVAFILVLTDITEQRRLERQSRDFSKRILQVQEEERRRVARELHDGINPLLAVARYRLEAAEEESDSSEMRAARGLLERAIGEVRTVSEGLRPPMLDMLGLRAALRDLGSDFAARTGVALEGDWGTVPERLPGEWETAVYRIVQESLYNVERHAQASKVAVACWVEEGRLIVRIEDDGRGLVGEAVEGRSAGWRNIRERASLLGGEAVFDSSFERGTRLRVELPMEEAGDDG